LDELRWILLGLGILAIGVIWLWTARGSRQAPGNAELREPTLSTVHSVSSTPPELPSERREAAAEKREWGISPLEPLSIRTADFADVPALDQPMLTHADPVDFSLDSSRATGAPRFEPPPASPPPAPLERTIEVDLELTVEAHARPEPVRSRRARVEPARSEPAPERAPERAPAPAPEPAEPPASAEPAAVRTNAENSDRHAAAAPSPNNSEKQKIVTVRVCAVGDARWAGADLMNALEALGLAYGRYQVYHRNHTDGRSIFCVASLVEPGTFDLSTMADEEFRGVSLFAILPGPLEPVQTVDALLATARELARALIGTMQDAKGMPFSPQRTEALLQDVARFQAALV
jgi:cell division protein ZipA